MKSPVPVVMSNSGSSSPSGSTETTPSRALDLNAVPSMVRLASIAGSTVWKNRSRSRSPPTSRTHWGSLAHRDFSTTNSKPKRRNALLTVAVCDGLIIANLAVPLE
jgi:hypothetical protein